MDSALTFAVIGSNCFTGVHIVDALLERPGTRVVGLSRSPEKSSLYVPYRRHPGGRFGFVQVNLVKETQRLLSILDELRPEVVINTAALSEVYQSHLTPNEYFAVNCSAVVQLANELRTRPWLKRYIHISTAEVYGSCASAVNEEAPLAPSTPYAASKAAADMYLLTAARHHGFPVTLVRSTNVYGRHQQLFKIIPRTMIFLETGKRIELHGGGTAIRPFIHIRDVVGGILKIVDHPAPQTVYHFSTSQDLTIAGVIRSICEKLGQDFERVTCPVDQRPAQDARYWLATRRARELGWAPAVGWDEGLEETHRWLRDNWKQVLAEPLQYTHRVD